MEDVVLTANGTLVLANNWAPLWTLLANAGGTYLCYVFGKFACKILIQGFSYAFPVNLSVPTALSLLVAACALYNTNNCAFYEHLPGYLFFNYPSYYSLESLAGNYYAWAWLFWMLSQAWIAIHIWRPECERLARTEKIFVRPMYDAFLIDQSMALNRRRDDRAEKLEEEDGYDSDGGKKNISPVPRYRLLFVTTQKQSRKENHRRLPKEKGRLLGFTHAERCGTRPRKR